MKPWTMMRYLDICSHRHTLAIVIPLPSNMNMQYPVTHAIVTKVQEQSVVEHVSFPVVEFISTFEEINADNEMLLC